MAGLAFAQGTLTVARGATVVFDNDDTAPHTVTARPGPVPPTPPSTTGPGAGVSAFVLATAVVAAFLGGIGISAFALRRRTAT
jgi:plastocyanin